MDPKFKDIRMVAFDLDGTLLTQEKKITPRTTQALEDAISRGLLLVPVTGRPCHGLPGELLEIPGIDYAITSNGAVTGKLQKTGGYESILRSSLIDRETAAEIVTYPLAHTLLYNVFIDGFGYSDADTYQKIFADFQDTPLEEYVRESRRTCSDIQTLLQNDGNGVENIWIVTENRNQQEQFCRYVEERWKLRTVAMRHFDVEIGNLQADKGVALAEFARDLGIPKNQVLAIGDDQNDLGMLQAAGIGVAMENAAQTVKQAANVITASHEEDGVAKILEQLL